MIHTQAFYRSHCIMRRVALYTRVSTDHQTTENQEIELRAVADRRGWQIVEIYRDEGVSGAKARADRPAFDALCKAATRNEFDMVTAWSVDRLGRSLQDLVGFLSELHALKINLFLHQQGLDTTTPAGKAMFQMMGVFAEFERSMIRERVKAGLVRARAQGKALGRPTIDAKTEAAIRQDLQKGEAGIRKLATFHGVGVGTVQRIKAQLTAC
jgi:DNA invertase Pin-like site-specific DNA recombinase